ncbi:MAG TPA: hypothetical protein VF655_06110 [Allosphingosinicella sp.]
MRRPYRFRTWLRMRLPWALIDLSPKGRDCEAAGGCHHWYNHDDVTSRCMHCEVERPGQLWRRGNQD